MYNLMELSRFKKTALTCFALGVLIFAVDPVEGRHGFHGGSIKDSDKIAEEVKLYAEQVERYKQEVQKYTILAQKFCALVGLDAPAFLNTVNKYSNAYSEFNGKTIVDMDNQPTSELDLVKDMGQYDLLTMDGRRNYYRHLLEQYHLTDLEALQLMSRYATNDEIKQKMIDEAMKIKVSETIDNQEVGSRTAVIQKENIITGLQANADINNAQNEIVQMTVKAEKARLDIFKESQERNHMAALNVAPDPYHMSDEEKAKWKEINQPEVTFGFTGQKK